MGLLKSARFHQLRAPRECQVSPTRFHLLWASSRVPGFTNFRPPCECRVSPALDRVSFTYFTPLASCAGFTFLGPLKVFQVSATLGLLKSARFHQLRAPRECQVSPTLGPSEAASFTYFRPLASCRLHLFWAPWKRPRFHLLWASSRVPGFTNYRPLASARFHQLWPLTTCKLQVSPTLGPSQAAGLREFWV